MVPMARSTNRTMADSYKTALLLAYYGRRTAFDYLRDDIRSITPMEPPIPLRRPSYAIEDIAFGPLDPAVLISPRIAPSTFGMGLLEAIPRERILALADPDDADGDGVSGRPNMVWDIRQGQFVLGRFGWKAGQPTVEQQAAAAFRDDIGITSSLFSEQNCPPAQSACLRAPNGGAIEIPDDRLAKVTFYVQTLAVPAMRNVDDEKVRWGARLFVETDCAACHTPRHVTGQDHAIPALRNQTNLPLHGPPPPRYGRGLGRRTSRRPGNR